MALEKKRDERLVLKQKMAMPHEDIESALGSASPSYGRRKKRAYKQEIDADEDEDAKSEAESEPDLGPLRFKEQLEGHQDDGYDMDEHHEHMQMIMDQHGHGHHDGHGHGHHDHHGHEPHPMAQPRQLGATQEEQVDRDEEAKELVLEATEHVVQTIKDRCKGARNLVVGEMGEARQVLQGIGNVLEVLGRRARSLEAQQEQILPPEVVARVKKEAAEEDEQYM